MSKHLILLFLCVPALLLTGCGTNPSHRLHPDYSDLTTNVSKVLLVPADIVFEEITFTGDNPRLTEKETEIAKVIVPALTAELGKYNYAVCNADLAALNGEDPDLSFNMNQVKESYTAAQETLYKNKMSTKEDFDLENIEEISNSIAASTGCDALLYVDFYAYERSAGLVAKDIAVATVLAVLSGSVSVPVRSAAVAKVALIDAHSGDILWVNSSQVPVTGNKFNHLFTTLAVKSGLPLEVVAVDEACDGEGCETQSSEVALEVEASAENSPEE